MQLMKAKRFSCPHCRVLNKLEGPQEGAQDVMRAAGLQTITTGASAPSRLDSRSSFRHQHTALNGPSPRLVQCLLLLLGNKSRFRSSDAAICKTPLACSAHMC